MAIPFVVWTTSGQVLRSGLTVTFRMISDHVYSDRFLAVRNHSDRTMLDLVHEGVRFLAWRGVCDTYDRTLFLQWAILSHECSWAAEATIPLPHVALSTSRETSARVTASFAVLVSVVTLC